MADRLDVLTYGACRERAADCRKLASQIRRDRHRLILEHIADAWDQIARELHANQILT